MPQHRAPPFSTKARPSPRGFADYFVANGWTETKLEFQCQTPQMIRWIAEFELSGRDLKAERRAHMRRGGAAYHNRKNGVTSPWQKAGIFPYDRVSDIPSIDPEFDELSYA